MEKLAANYLRVRSNGQITLPAEIRRKVGVREGDLFKVIVESEDRFTCCRKHRRTGNWRRSIH